MPRYYFSLHDDRWPEQSGEDLPNDTEAERYGEKVARELQPDIEKRPHVRIFAASGRRIK